MDKPVVLFETNQALFFPVYFILSGLGTKKKYRPCSESENYFLKGKQGQTSLQPVGGRKKRKDPTRNKQKPESILGVRRGE